MEETKTKKQNRTIITRKSSEWLFWRFLLSSEQSPSFSISRYKATHITTDDAYVDGSIHTIASKVTGTVITIYVKDNQAVKKGDLLLEIDQADYRVKVNEASSGVGAEKAKLIEMRHSNRSIKKSAL